MLCAVMCVVFVAVVRVVRVKCEYVHPLRWPAVSQWSSKHLRPVVHMKCSCDRRRSIS